MGLYVHFRGIFECVRCLATSDARIQTKLLRTDTENALRDYRVGDSEVMDGLNSYNSLHQWDGRTPLVIAVGDWDCDHCSLHWQWVRATLEVQSRDPHPCVVIRELSTFQPCQPSDLDGVHYVEDELARLSEFCEEYNWVDWPKWSLNERCERVAAGYREWCREVAEVQPRRGDWE